MKREDVALMLIAKEAIRELFEHCDGEECIHEVRRDVIDIVWNLSDSRIKDLTNNIK